MLKKILVATLFLSVVALPGAHAEGTSTSANPDRATHQAAKEAYKVAIASYKNQKQAIQTAKTAARAAIESAKATLNGVRSSSPSIARARPQIFLRRFTSIMNL